MLVAFCMPVSIWATSGDGEQNLMLVQLVWSFCTGEELARSTYQLPPSTFEFSSGLAS